MRLFKKYRVKAHYHSEVHKPCYIIEYISDVFMGIKTWSRYGDDKGTYVWWHKKEADNVCKHLNSTQRGII